MPDKNRPEIPPPLTIAEYVRHQTQGGQHLVDLLLRVARKHEASENNKEQVDPGERLAGVIAIAALAHLANGPEGPTEQKKRAVAEKSATVDRARAGTKL